MSYSLFILRRAQKELAGLSPEAYEQAKKAIGVSWGASEAGRRQEVESSARMAFDGWRLSSYL